MDKNPNVIVCNWCGQKTSVIWIHGFDQCKRCGTNIDECCRGEINTKDELNSH
jgi:hypothetical protein